MKKEKSKDWKKFKENNEADSELLFSDLSDEEKEASPSSLEHPDYAGLEEKLTLAEQKAHENWEKAVRAQAELDNVRRRAEKDIANAWRYGLEKFITSLLPVIDSLEQALQLADKDTNASMHEGLELTMRLLLTALEKQEVTQLDPLGEIFDPQEQEAMSIQEAPGAAPNSVVAVFQKGYKLADRVIRPARVIVAKAKSQD